MRRTSSSSEGGFSSGSGIAFFLPRRIQKVQRSVPGRDGVLAVAPHRIGLRGRCARTTGAEEQEEEDMSSKWIRYAATGAIALAGAFAAFATGKDASAVTRAFGGHAAGAVN